MNDEIDFNLIASDAATQLVKDGASSVFRNIVGKAKFVYEVNFKDFENYLLSFHRKISSLKIITSKDIPVNFTEIYTPSDFECDSKTYSDAQVVDIIISGKRCVISGNGGAGKTFMTRYIWMELFNKKSKKIPILIELRKLNTLSTYDIINFVRANAFGTAEMSEAAFKHFCSEGAFIFILDGFDEVSRDKREELERQIITLSDKYTKCGLVITGRPDDRFDAWSTFRTFKAKPFNYDKFKTLVNKVPFDLETKRAFLRLATEKFYKEHSSFLSNPLLALMMLLTFRDNAEIPSRLSTFYDNCFGTLYGQHDALKESFNRKKSLDQLQFKRMFSAFSLITYLKPSISFDAASLIDNIEQGKKIAKINVPHEDIQHDFLESVNLLVKDGFTYTYIHRSFQEFFAAYCVTNVIASKHEEILLKFSKRNYDSTLKLTYEMHPELVEDKLIIPSYSRLKNSGSLPRRAQKDFPFAALHGAGFVLVLSINLKTNEDGSYSGFSPSAFRPLWKADYEACSVSTNIASSYVGYKAKKKQFDAVVDVIAGEFLSPEAIHFSNTHSLNGKTVMIRVSYNKDSYKFNTTSYGEVEFENGDSINHLLAPMVERISDKLEKILIDNNKDIVAISEEIRRRRVDYDDALADVVS